MAKSKKSKAGAKKKATISLSRETEFRLDVLVADTSRQRGRRVSRSELVEELLAPHLKRVIVTIRPGPVETEEAAA